MKVAYMEKNACQQSLIGPLPGKWGLQIITVWLIQIAQPWLVRMEQLRLVSKDTNKGIAAQLDSKGKVSDLLVEFQSQVLYFKGWFIMQEHSAQADSSACSFHLIYSVYKRLLPQWLLDSSFELGPINHKESFLAGIFFFGIKTGEHKGKFKSYLGRPRMSITKLF